MLNKNIKKMNTRNFENSNFKNYANFSKCQNNSEKLSDFGKIFDRNCVGVIDRPNYEEGRKAITDIFDNVFCTTYTEEHIMKNLHYYPRGIIEIE